jgi:hypothetical protein
LVVVDADWPRPPRARPFSGDGALDLAEMRRVPWRAPATALRPALFLRVVKEMPVTATVKHHKNDLKQDAYDPAAGDALYFDCPKRQAFVPRNSGLRRRVVAGKMRL